jgi:hypothetical protein
VEWDQPSPTRLLLLQISHDPNDDRPPDQHRRIVQRRVTFPNYNPHQQVPPNPNSGEVFAPRFWMLNVHHVREFFIEYFHSKKRFNVRYAIL